MVLVATVELNKFLEYGVVLKGPHYKLINSPVESVVISYTIKTKPGTSGGGGVFNEKGELVAINSFIMSYPMFDKITYTQRTQFL